MKEREDFLLYYQGMLALSTGETYSLRYEKEVPHFFASFFMNGLLFICGGQNFQKTGYSALKDLLAADSAGKCTTLAPMSQQRSGPSLAGLPAGLVALGGANVELLQVCELYLGSVNKWEPLPPLKTARWRAGGCLLPSLRVFCFCGVSGEEDFLSSIERVDLKREAEWSTLPLH